MRLLIAALIVVLVSGGIWYSLERSTEPERPVHLPRAVMGRTPRGDELWRELQRIDPPQRAATRPVGDPEPVPEGEFVRGPEPVR